MSVRKPDQFTSAAFSKLRNILEVKTLQYNQPSFITTDPVSIPHKFSKKQDIEIAGFFAAILAWGQRTTIIAKTNALLERMDNAPHEFILRHSAEDLRKLTGFVHRTFNDTDLLYFVAFLNFHYTNDASLETAFIPPSYQFTPGYLPAVAVEPGLNSPVCYANDQELTIEAALNYFRSYFFSLEDFPLRTKKHISAPSQNSTCKRLNMFLRWMVRKDNCGVDFGIWKTLQPAMLICPCDVHVDRVARSLGLITRKQTDWKTALELTEYLRMFDPMDPVKYDFALFGMGIENGARSVRA